MSIHFALSDRYWLYAFPAKVIKMDFRCRNCRSLLFNEKDLVTHEMKQQRIAYRKLHKNGPGLSAIECTSLFLHESAMEELSASLSMIDDDGKIACSNVKCQTRIGSFSWAGSQCSCGSWIAPSIQIVKSKVDRQHF